MRIWEWSMHFPDSTNLSRVLTQRDFLPRSHKEREIMKLR